MSLEAMAALVPWANHDGRSTSRRWRREMAHGEFSPDDARRIGDELEIDWATSPFDVEQYRMGLNVELEHGAHDPQTNVTNDDEILTGKIALAHLKEFPDYYTRLERMEAEAKTKWAGQPGRRS